MSGVLLILSVMVLTASADVGNPPRAPGDDSLREIYPDIRYAADGNFRQAAAAALARRSGAPAAPAPARAPATPVAPPLAPAALPVAGEEAPIVDPATVPRELVFPGRGGRRR